jgi:release factor glutamine methyltransferase
MRKGAKNSCSSNVSGFACQKEKVLLSPEETYLMAAKNARAKNVRPVNRPVNSASPKVYLPREDSFLLRDQVRNYARSRVLDMGTGTGILAAEAAKCSGVNEVVAADIGREAIDYCRKHIRSKKIRFVVSDLFSNAAISGKFDLIIFNPPYLPRHPVLKDAALDGGKNGYEVAVRFLGQAKKHLAKKGKILLLISSLTKRKAVEQAIRKNKLRFRVTATKKIDFEALYVYLIGLNEGKRGE